MEAKAILRSARISAAEGAPGRRPGPRHCRSARARNLLAVQRQEGRAALIKKVLRPAVANAENNLGADVDELQGRHDHGRRGSDA